MRTTKKENKNQRQNFAVLGKSSPGGCLYPICGGVSPIAKTKGMEMEIVPLPINPCDLLANFCFLFP
jgi:hypothetical protein